MIIGITGLKGSGKDTIADFLIKEYGYKKMAFADTLKDAVAVTFGWDREMLEGVTQEHRKTRELPDEFWSKALNRPFSPRNALELVGTQLFRDNFDKNFWVHCLRKRIEESGCKKIVITDVRFRNEIEAIRSVEGSQIWRVQRGELPEWFNYAAKFNIENPDKTPIIPNVHASECSWQGIDCPNIVLFNNGTIQDLHNDIKSIMEK